MQDRIDEMVSERVETPDTVVQRERKQREGCPCADNRGCERPFKVKPPDIRVFVYIQGVVPFHEAAAEGRDIDAERDEGRNEGGGQDELFRGVGQWNSGQVVSHILKVQGRPRTALKAVLRPFFSAIFRYCVIYCQDK